MKIITIVGARPQFIKAAVLSRLIRSDEWRNKFNELLLHTGQHYDDNMSEVFFRDMKIPQPDINLNIGSATHGQMTGQMLIQIENVLLKEKPDIVIVYGDTNSTLAGALAAAKLLIPVAHIEAGLRSFNKAMPEEQNRIVTDHLSEWLFCPTETAVNNLKTEGVTKGVHLVGDIMYDAALYYKDLIKEEQENGVHRLNAISGLKPEIFNSPFALATVHRAENTDNFQKLANIVNALNQLNTTVILPLHPRTLKKIQEQKLIFSKNVFVTKPVGYLEMLELEMKAEFIITDSGGVQKEAYFMKKPCITLREETEWIETVKSGWNKLVGTNTELITSTSTNINYPEMHKSFYGSGQTARNILSLLN